ncbi:unnamed protein product [Prunus brigantina]
MAAESTIHAAGIAAPLVAVPNHGPMACFTLPPQGPSDGAILEQIRTFPPLQPHLTYAPVCASNGALSHMSLGPIHTSLPDLCSQINLNQVPDLGARDEARRIREHTDEHLERSRTNGTRINGQETERAEET